MKNNFWFAVTVLMSVFLAAFAIDWLAQPQVVYAAAADMLRSAAADPALTLTGIPPVQAVVTLVVVLFGVLTLAAMIEEDGKR